MCLGAECLKTHLPEKAPDTYDAIDTCPGLYRVKHTAIGFDRRGLIDTLHLYPFGQRRRTNIGGRGGATGMVLQRTTHISKSLICQPRCTGGLYLEQSLKFTLAP